ncbi:MAG: hypothetical protein JWN96_4310, partial [Mycobacterium sp.]|nr:hypothetical protein [Mycobacterium sp.]
VWVATTGALVGFVDPASGQVRVMSLGAGEHVDNSISTAPAGTAVATDHALYLLRVDPTGAPRVVWRQPYDRGPARKPGQLSWGSGATPTFFGPRTGAELLAITDNAVPRENLLVYSAATGEQVCKVPTVQGTENSPIGYGNTVYVAGTYGYPYPAVPADAGTSQPASAPFAGGLTRVDLTSDGCRVAWNVPVRSSAVPRLSLGDNLLYTMTRELPLGGDGSSPLDLYRYTVIDPATGAIRTSQLVGATSVFDTLQMVGSISRDRVLYQGTLTGILRVAAVH